jgi:hypothetical protein
VAYGKDSFVAVGVSGTIITSTNGTNWIVRNSTTSNDLFAVANNGQVFIAVGAAGPSDPGVILVSTNGVTWNRRDSGTGESLYGISFGDGIFLAVGTGGIVLSSTDGVTWTSRNSGAADFLDAASYGNGTFLIVGNSDQGERILQSEGLDSPQLDISMSRGSLVIAWPLFDSQFILESVSALPASSNWSPITVPPTVVNGKLVVATDLSSERRFFRLRQP